MPQRFTIEDIEVQDCSGVIFRAVDSVTGGTVAVRRFFPFGPTGGGLTADEQEQYTSAVKHLETIDHPSLRSIVSGGCDPVDGIPFIATEWVEGISLRHILAERSLSRAEVTSLLVHALEACEALSAVLGREGIWIETDVQTIIIGAEETHRPITFWISPLRWLGQLSGQKGMEPLVVLAETAMGWSGEPASGHGSRGLAEWLQWLRKEDWRVSLAEARERLISTAGPEAGPVAQRPTLQATAPVRKGSVRTDSMRTDPKRANKKSRVPAWILGCCILSASGLCGWMLIQKNQQRIAEASRPLTPIESISRHGETLESDSSDIPLASHDQEITATGWRGSQRTSEQVSQEAAERMIAATQADRELNERMEKVRRRDGVYLASDGDLLANIEKGSWVKIEGILANVHSTKAGNIYLSFPKERGKTVARAYVESSNTTPDLNEASLKNLKDHRIQIEGILRFRNKRPEVMLKQRSAITQP